MDLSSPTSLNFIRLGAIAQKLFDMKENYRIEIFAPDSQSPVRLVVYPHADEISRDPSPFGRAPLVDIVKLHLFASTDDFYVRAGYSAKANVLCVSQVVKSL